MLLSAPSAVEVATGSVASAATSSAGLSPRRSARSKPRGTSMANSTSPDASTRSNSASSRTCRVTLKYLVFSSALRMVRPTSLRLLQQHRGRQVARLGVDGIAEQQELHQRQGDDGGEGDAVAAKLHELLADHRARPAARTRGATGPRASAHAMLSLACAISPMKTSSSDASIGFQCSFGSSRCGGDRGLERRAVAAGYVQARAERRHAVDAGPLLQLGGQRRAAPRRSRCRWRGWTA